MTDPAVVDAVLTANRSLIAVSTRSLDAAADETTIAQYRALVGLASRGPQRMSDLAGALDVAPSTAGRMCDRLVRKGLIRRYPARADRRAVLVSVTAAGRVVVDQVTARRRTLIAEILARLPAGAAADGRRSARGVRRGRWGDTGQPVAPWTNRICPGTSSYAPSRTHSRRLRAAGMTGMADQHRRRPGAPLGCRHHPPGGPGPDDRDPCRERDRRIEVCRRLVNVVPVHFPSGFDGRTLGERRLPASARMAAPWRWPGVCHRRARP